MDLESISMFGRFAFAGGVALAASLFAALREHRHRRRTNLDQVSFVSWSLLSALTSMMAIILLATAARIYITSMP